MVRLIFTTVYLQSILVQETSRDRAARLASEISNCLDKIRTRSIQILGPAPAPLEKLNKTYRQQLLIKSATRKPLHRLLAQLQEYLDQNKISPTTVIIDVDPISLM